MKSFTLTTALIGILSLDLSTFTWGQPNEIKVTTVDYIDVDDFMLQGFKSVPEDYSANGERIPAVIVLPDWDGVYTYEQQRATMLAEMGYVGFAADIYGVNDHVVEDFNRRVELATLYRSNITLFVQRIKAAVDLVKAFDEVDPEKVAIIGYCFGGTGVLDYALTGQDDVVALVSFHGGLSLIPDAGPDIIPKLLVLSGGDDDTSTDIIDLENTLSASDGNWEITRYSGIQHAFTVFGGSAYNALADQRSWYSMSTFLSEAFGMSSYIGNQPDTFDVTPIGYTDIDGTDLQGYIAFPANMKKRVPAVVILPDWDGVNTYEKERASMLAESGYVAFAADIYGVDLQEDLSFDVRIAQSTIYRSNPTLYNRRIQLAIDFVRTLSTVDSENIAIIGYCFGGTGVFEYAYSGSTDVKVGVSFHGGHTNLPRPMANIQPYVLVLSGGVDDAHGNQTLMESSMNERSASWEITRYAKVDHGYTSWTSRAYNTVADARSWDSMMTTFASMIPIPDGDGEDDGDENMNDNDVFCFAGDTMVDVQSVGAVSIRDLKLGDMVDVGENKYSKVYSFGHKDEYSKAKYILVHSDTLQQPLKVSQHHMVLVMDKSQNKNKAIPASLLKTGDNLILSSGKYGTVTKISSVWGKGAFAPFTTAGVIAVNGVLASNYVSLQHDSDTFMIGGVKTHVTMQWLSHAFQAPHRLVCQVAWSYCERESYTKTGISNWVSYPLQVFEWILSRPSWPFLVLFTPFIIGLALLLSLSEQILMWVHWVLPLVAALHYVRNSKTYRLADFKKRKVPN